MLKMIGDYRYSGAIIDGRKYSIVRNGDEIQRINEVFDGRNAERIWNNDQPMTLDVLEILRHECK